MNGLKIIPQLANLRESYNRLLGDQNLSVGELVTYSQWARFDPRLAEIWVRWMVENWKKVNPIEMNESLLKSPWPGAGMVLLEFVSLAIEKQNSSLFYHWKKIVSDQVKKAHFEQYFIGLRSIAGKQMFDDARFSMQEYLVFGYLGREVLFNKAVSLQKPMYSFGIDTRKEILKSLLETRSRITVSEYWIALGQSISRRQAERDLLCYSGLKPMNHTKGRFFVKK